MLMTIIYRNPSKPPVTNSETSSGETTGKTQCHIKVISFEPARPLSTGFLRRQVAGCNLECSPSPSRCCEWRTGWELKWLPCGEWGWGRRGAESGGQQQDYQVFHENLEVWNFRGNLSIFKNWNQFNCLKKLGLGGAQPNMPVGQNQLAGTQLVTTGLRHVDKWTYG